MKHLQSSAANKGKYVTQIITATTGVKKTIHDIDTSTIQQGQFTKFKTKDGRLIMINDDNVFCIEIF